jgi:hypothetical protein
MQNSRKTRLLVGVAGFVLGLGALAWAEGDFDWTDLFPLDQAMQFEAISWQNGDPPGPKTIVRSTRGPLTAGTYSISNDVIFESNIYGTLQSARFLVADDSNSNNNIDASEWTVVATANAVQQGGQWIASIPQSVVSANKAVYRVEFTYLVGGTPTKSWDEVIDSHLTTSPPP